MAKDKTSFILYTDSYGLIKQLPDDVAGRLLKHIFAYVNDEDPITDELVVNIAFEPIKMQLKRDLIKWEAEIENKSESGAIGNLKRWNIDLYEKFKSKEITLLEAISIAKHRTPSHPIAFNDNVNDNVNDILLKKESKEIFSFKNALIDFGFEKKLIEEWLKVRKTKKATNTETAFKKFIKQVQDTNAPINEILELCVVRSWAGFETEWVNNLQNQNLQNGKQYSNSGGANSNQGYKPASVDTEKLVRELTNDIEVGNVPGQY